MSDYSFKLWIFLASDVERPIGGVKQLYRFCEACQTLGVTSTVIQKSQSFRPSWFTSEAPAISLAAFNSLKLNPSVDLLVIPETVVDSTQSFHPQLKRIIFNQNSSYTFGLDDKSIVHPRALFRHYQNALHSLVISQYDHLFLSSLFSLDESSLSLLINPI